MERALRLQPGQQELTPTQKVEAKRFAEAYIQTQLSIESVDEAETEAFLRQAYRVAGLAPPQHIQWLDDPLQFVAVLTPQSVQDRVLGSVLGSVQVRLRASIGERACLTPPQSSEDSVLGSVQDSVEDSFRARLRASIGDRAWESVLDSVWDGVCPPWGKRREPRRRNHREPHRGGCLGQLQGRRKG